MRGHCFRAILQSAALAIKKGTVNILRHKNRKFAAVSAIRNTIVRTVIESALASV